MVELAMRQAHGNQTHAAAARHQPRRSPLQAEEIRPDPRDERGAQTGAAEEQYPQAWSSLNLVIPNEVEDLQFRAVVPSPVRSVACTPRKALDSPLSQPREDQLYFRPASSVVSLPNLPHPTAISSNHRLPNLTAESLLKFLHIHHQSVDAILPRRVRIGDRRHALVFWPIILAGPLRIADEEALFR